MEIFKSNSPLTRREVKQILPFFILRILWGGLLRKPPPPSQGMGVREQQLWYGNHPLPNLQLVRATHPPFCYSHSPGGTRKGGEDSWEQMPNPRSKKSPGQIFLVTVSCFVIPEPGLIVFWKMGGLVLKTGWNFTITCSYLDLVVGKGTTWMVLRGRSKKLVLLLSPPLPSLAAKGPTWRASRERQAPAEKLCALTPFAKDPRQHAIKKIPIRFLSDGSFRGEKEKWMFSDYLFYTWQWLIFFLNYYIIFWMGKLGLTER